MSPRIWLAVAGLLMALGIQLGSGVHGWHEVLTPGFVAGFLVNVATVIYALYQQPPISFEKKNGITGMLLVIGTSLMLTSACASAPASPALVAADQQVYRLMVSAVGASEQAHTEKLLTDAEFKKVNVVLNRVSRAGRDVTKLARAKQAMPSDWFRFAGAIAQSVSDVRASVPDQTKIAGILDQLLQLEKLAHSLVGQ